MAERGDVLRVKRRLGFGAERGGELVIVVQASPLSSVLPTTIVVPLDASAKAAHPSLTVRVSAKEVGGSAEQYALASQLQVTLLDRLAPGRVGRLAPKTLRLLDDKLRLVLEL
jgi:mRNA-degrading endonuclease toxin of MazEF toxin-antitoxin module